jgi:O-antigen/teichoic acid export membrane protein
MLMLSLPIFILAGYLAVPILRMFGPGFDVAAPAMAVLAVGQFVNVSVGTAGTLLTMSDRTYLNAINTAAAFALGLLLAFTLIPRYGLLGAAIAQAATMALVNAIRVVEVRLVLKMKPYPRSYVKPVLAGAVGGVLGLVGHNLFASNGQIAQRVAGTCLLLVGYAVALLLQKVEPEERDLWRSLWGRIGRMRSERHQAG